MTIDQPMTSQWSTLAVLTERPTLRISPVPVVYFEHLLFSRHTQMFRGSYVIRIHACNIPQEANKKSQRGPPISNGAKAKVTVQLAVKAAARWETGASGGCTGWQPPRGREPEWARACSTAVWWSLCTTVDSFSVYWPDLDNQAKRLVCVLFKVVVGDV